jgi:serine/threonine protein kinase
LARLEHPHIVPVYTSGEHNGEPYFVMALVEGGSLDRKLQGRPQPPCDAARLVLLLARALHAAHQAGIVHRDLNPGNVLLAPPAAEPALNCAYGCPRLTDFGLSKCLDNTRHRTEQYRNGPRLVAALKRSVPKWSGGLGTSPESSPASPDGNQVIASTTWNWATFVLSGCGR